MPRVAPARLTVVVRDNLPALRVAWRRLSRLRFLAKYRVLQYSGASLRDRSAQRYLLLDPEVESHTYELANPGAIAERCADLLDLPVARVHELMDEARTDAELTTELRRRTRWAFDLKTQPPIGKRVVWWVIVRATRPSLVVETGIYDGLGSLVLLRALERNHDEGGPDGRLLSVDADTRAGRLVPGRLRSRWEVVHGYTDAVLEPALRGREIDLLVHDTPHVPEVQGPEFDIALRHGAAVLRVLDEGGGQTPVLRELAEARGGQIVHLEVQSLDHPYSPPGLDIATFAR